MQTNNERAERGRILLQMYGENFGDPMDVTANLTDILADLMHLAHLHSEYNFKRGLEIAKMHFEEELLEEVSG